MKRCRGVSFTNQRKESLSGNRKIWFKLSYQDRKFIGLSLKGEGEDV